MLSFQDLTFLVVTFSIVEIYGYTNVWYHTAKKIKFSRINKNVHINQTKCALRTFLKDSFSPEKKRK